MMEKWILHMLMLGLCSAEDYREKKISMWKFILYAGIAVGYGIWEYSTADSQRSVWMAQSVLGSLPGLLMLCMGKLSQEAVGYGDGLLVLIMGVSIGFWETMGILFTASIGAGAAALYTLLRHKGGRKKQIAFAPFLFLGMARGRVWLGI